MSVSRVSGVFKGGVLASLFVLGGCGQVSGDWVSETSNGVTFFHHPSTTVCGGDSKRVRRLLDEISAFAEVPRVGEVEYYLTDPDEIGDYCPGASACADIARNRIFASQPDHVHEMAHLVLPSGTLFFSEGIADYLFAQTGFYITEEFDVLAELNEKPAELTHQRTLVAYLVEKFGIKAMVDLLSRTHPHIDADSFLQVYEDIYGATPAEHVKALLDWTPAWEVSGGRPWNTCRGYGTAKALQPGDSAKVGASCSDGYGPSEEPVGVVLLESTVDAVRATGSGTLLSCERDEEFDLSEDAAPTTFVGDFSGLWQLSSKSEIRIEGVRAGSDCEANFGGPWLEMEAASTLVFARAASSSYPFRVAADTYASSSNPFAPVELCDDSCSCSEMEAFGPPVRLEASRTYWARNLSSTGLTSSGAQVDFALN